MTEENVVMKITDSGPSVDTKVAEKMFSHSSRRNPAVWEWDLDLFGDHSAAWRLADRPPSKPHGMEFRIVLPHCQRS